MGSTMLTEALTEQRRQLRQSRHASRGTVALEFALVLAALAMMLIGTVTTGMSYSQALSITNAVREGSRFGATADASGGTWVSDTLGRVSSTQFDPAGAQTSMCVSLFKQGTGTVAGRSGCNLGSGPALTAPDAASDNPAVPTGLGNGQCVVRVIAARTFTINLVVFGSITRTMTRYAVDRYEGTAGC